MKMEVIIQVLNREDDMSDWSDNEGCYYRAAGAKYCS